MRDLKNAVIVLLSILIFGMLFATVLYSNAEAQPLTTYDELFCFSRGFDTWTIDSAVFRLFEGTLATDSGANLTYDTARYASRVDTLCFIVNLSATTISKTRNPSILGVAFLSDGRQIHDVKSVAHMVHSVDTARQSPNATATADTAAIARSVWDDDVVALANRTATATSAAGVGPDTLVYHVLNSADSTPIGGVSIWVYPNEGGTPWKNITESNGIAEFGLNTPDTVLGYTWVSGWTQDTVPDSVLFTAAVRDTLFMTAVTAASPSAANLSAVTFNFMAGSGDTTTNVILRYKLSSTSSENWYVDSTWILDPSEVFEARSDTLGQVTVNVVPNDSIYTAGYQTDKTTWQFWAINPTTGKQILGEDGIKIFVPWSASGLVWPEDFE